MRVGTVDLHYSARDERPTRQSPLRCHSEALAQSAGPYRRASCPIKPAAMARACATASRSPLQR